MKIRKVNRIERTEEGGFTVVPDIYCPRCVREAEKRMDRAERKTREQREQQKDDPRKPGR